MANPPTTKHNPNANLALENERPTEIFGLSSFSDKMWESARTIDGGNWNKSFPYQLLVMEGDKTAYTFTLPIPPESLTITTPFAINTQVTLGGIVEEHNGAPIRTLSFSGTFGVLPARTSAAGVASVTNAQALLGATMGFAAGTITAATAALQDRTTALSNIWGLDKPFGNTVSEADIETKGTGYFQFRLLQQFLESYANIKKSKTGKKYRLAVAIWKDQAIYFVTPVMFEVRRSAASPLEYMYSLQFKAWKRVTQLGTAMESGDRAQSPRMVLQNVLATISEARQILADSKNIAAAAVNDLGEIMEVLRQTVLFVKDSISAQITLSELPADLVLEIMRSTTAITEAAGGLVRGTSSDLNRLKSKYWLDSSGAVASELWDFAEEYFSVGQALSGNGMQSLSSTEVGSLPLPLGTKDKIDQAVAKARSQTRSDFEKSLQAVQDYADKYAKAVNAAGTTDSAIKRSPNEDDYNILFALNNAAMALSKLVVLSSQETAKEDAIAYVAGLATRSGIAFQQPVAKIAVPFPYGSTLEQIAARYLGDAKRWHEIAALNGLRSPYVDEEGFEIPLISNGKDSQVVVEAATNLYVGQPVTLSATNTPRTARRITKIDTIGPQMSLIHLSGADDLGRYTVMGDATLHAYLPNTVNSQMQIYIPSTDTPAERLLTSKTIPGVDEFDPMINAGGVDLLLTPSGDLAITQDGDCKLAVGLTNLVQRVRIALGTPRGTLPQHPDFGLGLRPGTSTADLTASELLEATKGMFNNDPAFTGVYSASVVKKGPTLSLSVSVGIAGQDIVLPISVDVKA